MDGGIQTDRAGHCGPVNQMRKERLARRLLEHAQARVEKARQDDMPDLHRLDEAQRGHYAEDEHVDRLGGDEQTTLVHPVRQGAPEQRQSGRRHRLGQAVGPKQKLRPGKLVDEPPLGDSQHLLPGDGNNVTGPPLAEGAGS